MRRVFIEEKGRFRDRTDEVRGVPELNDKGKCEVVFQNNSQKPYAYNPEKVAIAEERQIPVDPNVIYIHKGSELYNIVDIVALASENADFGEKVEVTFQNGLSRIYQASNLEKRSKAKASSRFRYLSSVAEAIKPDDKDSDVSEYLTRQYESLGEKSLEETAASYLIGKPSHRSKKTESSIPLIYPFGSNLSQMAAVEGALAHGLSVIEGPPGTGKTQTVLNIIANLLMRNATVLMVSPNNEATKNVTDKLIAHDFGFFVASLGRKENKEAFIANQHEAGALPRSFDTWEIAPQERDTLQQTVASLTKRIKETYRIEQKLFRLRQELRDIHLEHERFSERADVQPTTYRPTASSEQLAVVRNRVAQCANTERSVSWFDRIRYGFFWRIGRYQDYKHPDVITELRVGEALYRKREEELNAAISRLEDKLEGNGKELLAQQLHECSLTLFQAYLFDRYVADAGNRPVISNLWEEWDTLRRSYPVVTSTTNAARNQLGKGGELFDYVIMDESSQADLVTGFLALAAARSAVVVGDSKQLPCVITEQEREAAAPLFPGAELPHYFDYTHNSLLDCARECIRCEDLDAPTTILREHYRCHPDIIGFCNQQFYDGELIVMTPASPADDVLSLRISSQGNHDRKHDHNRIQAEMLFAEAIPSLSGRFSQNSIGVVSPYRRQVDAMENDVAKNDEIVIDTVHKFQGREKDAMVFVVGANDANAFVDDPRLVNVAVSRAKRALCLITAPQVVAGSGNLADLKRYISYHGGTEYETEVSPAFPLLYGSDLERQRYLLARGKDEADQYSEVQMEELLNEVIASEFAAWGISYCRNYPFKLLCQSGADLADDEERFVSRSAHGDFVFYRIVDNSVFLECEVNGSWHYHDERQQQRDALKRSILAKLGIPQLEVRTNETKRQVQDALKRAVSDAFLNGDAPSVVKVDPVVVSSKKAPWKEHS